MKENRELLLLEDSLNFFKESGWGMFAKAPK